MPADSQLTSHTSTRTFDARHRMIATDGPRTDVADVTSTGYYADDDATATRRGRARQITDAAGLTRSFDDYDGFGHARRAVDPNGIVATSLTDGRGRVTSSTSPPVSGDPNEATAYTRTSTFDGRDRLVETTLPRGNRSRYGYEDGTNRLIDTTRLDLPGNEVERRHLTLNVAGDKVREEDQVCSTAPAPTCASWTTKRRESYAYDDHNRLAAIQHPVPSGAQVLYSYDADGKLAAVQDENHTAPNTTYGYDALDRLTSVSQTLASAAGGATVTRYAYDVLDHLAVVTDANGNSTAYGYDDFGRMTVQSSPVTGATSYVYDSAGNLATTTDARGATTVRQYDALNRPLNAASSLNGAAETVTFAYDAPTVGAYGKGRLSSMSDPSGSTSYAYERRGLLRAETKTILGNAYSTSYGYDSNGNRSGITYPSGRQLSYGFDFGDRPQSLSGTLGGTATTYVASAAYEPFGPEASLVYGSGNLTRSATYDQRYEIQGFEVSVGGTPIASYGYGFDAVGNITAITDRVDPSFDRSFGYDDLYRLTDANTGSGLWGNGSYSYDAIGDRLPETLGTKSSSYSYVGSTSKLTAIAQGATALPVTYDAAGNEVQHGTETLVYSPRNYLDHDHGLRYVYDGTGLRVAQVGLAVGPLITTQPQSQTVCPGASATLSVAARGATGYQWQVLGAGSSSWSDIAGATGAAVGVAPALATQYRVRVDNAASSTVSTVATLTPVAVATEPTSGVLYGDVDRSGAVDAGDVTVLRAVLAGNQALGVPTAVADLNADGRVDAVDLSLLAAYSVHTIGCLPQPAQGALNALAVAKLASASTPTKQLAPNPTQYFFYSSEKHLLAQTDIEAAGGVPQGAVDYLWFGGRPVAEERVGGTSRFTVVDHLGTPILQTDVSGSPVWRAEYEPFGAVARMRAGSVGDERLRFPGQEYDEETGAREYNIFRWYEPEMGRFTAADPLGGGSGTLYGYADNDPVDRLDPLGLVAVFQTVGETFDLIDNGGYSLNMGNWFAKGKCVCAGSGWQIRLKLHFNHRYKCHGFGSCATEQVHVNIAWAFVARAAQYWNQFEKKTYSDPWECDRDAAYYAQDLQDHLLDRDPALWREYVRTQQDYEDTHHGWPCGWVPGTAGACGAH